MPSDSWESVGRKALLSLDLIKAYTERLAEQSAAVASALEALRQRDPDDFQEGVMGPLAHLQSLIAEDLEQMLAGDEPDGLREWAEKHGGVTWSK